MDKSGVATLKGDFLNVQMLTSDLGGKGGAHQYLLEVSDQAAAQILVPMLSMLDRLMAEKIPAERERRMSAIVDFMTSQIVTPSEVDLQMAQRLAARHARILREFGYYTGEQLADANGSQAASRSALVDNWRKRQQVFAVPHPEKSARDRDIYFLFSSRRTARSRRCRPCCRPLMGARCRGSWHCGSPRTLVCCVTAPGLLTC